MGDDPSSGGSGRAVAVPGSGPWRVAPYLLGALAAVLYAVSWNGRLFHDGAIFVQAVEEGEWRHYHLLYFPLAQTLRAALAPVADVSAEGTLGILSVASGAVLVALSFAVARRICGDPAAALVAAVLLALSPVVWLASGMAEIHILAGAGFALSLWLAVVPAFALSGRAAAASATSVLAHVSNGGLVPLLLGGAFLGEHLRGRRITLRAVLSATAAALAVAILVLVVGRIVRPQGGNPGEILAGMVEIMARTASAPTRFLSRLEAACLRPWMLLALAPLAALAVRPVPRAFVVATALFALLCAPILSCFRLIEGQYGLFLGAPLALLCASVLATVRGARRRRWVFTGCILLQLALSLPERNRLAIDEDRAWAEAVAGRVEEPCIVFCHGLARTLRFREAAGIRAVDFSHMGDMVRSDPTRRVVAAIRDARESGKVVYLDPQILARGEGVASLRRLVLTMKRVLIVERLSDAPLLRVAGVREE